MKFPVELFDVLPGLGAARMEEPTDSDDSVPEESAQPRRPAPKGKVTRVQDPELRSAIENHAVDRTIAYYKELDGTDFMKLGRPYDIKLMLNGVERHVEVKGSSLFIDTVELTINEVTQAEAFQPTDLVVVDGIDYHRGPNGITTCGGRVRIWRDWTPLDEDLAARKFAYTLPHD